MGGKGRRKEETEGGRGMSGREDGRERRNERKGG